MTKQNKPTTKVRVVVTDIIKHNCSFSIFMNIYYKPGVPLLREKDGQKERVGYWGMKDTSPEVTSEVIFHETSSWPEYPVRPVFKVGKNEYKLSLKQNDDFQECIESLAEILVESQGRTKMYYNDLISAKPQLEVSYKSRRLEMLLKRL